MTTPVDQAAARMAAQLDQLDAKGRDLGRLLEPLRPLAGARAGLVVAAAPARRRACRGKDAAGPARGETVAVADEQGPGVTNYCSRCRTELTWLTDVDPDDPAAVEQARADLLATHELECPGPDEGNTVRLTSRPW